VGHKNETARDSLGRKRKRDKSDVYDDACDGASSERNLCCVMEEKKNSETEEKYSSKEDHTVSVCLSHQSHYCCLLTRAVYCSQK